MDLLPYQVKQALVGPSVQKALTRWNRARSRPRLEVPTDTKRIFVDVSVISRHDAGTGIQRVVRALALGLNERIDTLQCEVHFVAAGRGTPYHTIAWPDGEKLVQPVEMEGSSGDVFIGLDYSLDDIRWNAEQIKHFRRQGGELWFLVHDLLPMNNSEWFSPNTIIRYRAWFDILANLTDGFLCNSVQTETELREALKRVYGLDGGYATKVLPMGYEIPEPHEIDPRQSARLVGLLEQCQNFFLQVGTLEPRKGHSQVLDAFEILWRGGMSEGLVFVGQRGWHVDNLYERISTHPMHGSKLFWFDDVQDPELNQMYQACKGSIIASLAEGFGLPLIEALGHRKPVLARDLAVFRQHEECGVQYFPAECDADLLASTLKRWSENIALGGIDVKPPEKSWKDAVSEMIKVVVQGQETA